MAAAAAAAGAGADAKRPNGSGSKRKADTDGDDDNKAKAAKLNDGFSAMGAAHVFARYLLGTCCNSTPDTPDSIRSSLNGLSDRPFRHHVMWSSMATWNAISGQNSMRKPMHWYRFVVHYEHSDKQNYPMSHATWYAMFFDLSKFFGAVMDMSDTNAFAVEFSLLLRLFAALGGDLNRPLALLANPATGAQHVTADPVTEACDDAAAVVVPNVRPTLLSSITSRLRGGALSVALLCRFTPVVWSVPALKPSHADSETLDTLSTAAFGDLILGGHKDKIEVLARVIGELNLVYDHQCRRSTFDFFAHQISPGILCVFEEGHPSMPLFNTTLWEPDRDPLAVCRSNYEHTVAVRRVNHDRLVAVLATRVAYRAELNSHIGIVDHIVAVWQIVLSYALISKP